MPDKKLTDSEIVKALECCHDKSDCGDCMYAIHRSHDGTCMSLLRDDLLDLINRLQAEKESLTAANIAIREQGYKSGYKDGAKEIERLKTLNSKLEAEVYKKGLL